MKFGQYVLKYSLTDLPNCCLDSDDCSNDGDFEMLNYRFINIQIFDVGSSSSSSIMPSLVVMFATVKPATVSIIALFDDGDVSSDDSNCEDDSNMILGNFKHRRLGSNVVSTIITDKVRGNPLVKIRDIMDYLKQDYDFEVAYHTTYRGKDDANQSLHGDEGIGYDYLPWYLEVIKRTKPVSGCVLDTQDGRFCRLFIAYRASLHGFQYCPPILFVDGTFIKNKYKGMLLDVCAKTWNKYIFPYAFAIVDAESKENWRWFFEQLAIILISDHMNIVFMTDRGSGLLDVIKEVFPSSPHSYCIKHLKDNLFGRLSNKLSASYRDTLVSSFAACAYART
ncbi:hypothetical protein ACLB2K_052039 [Fragaria x ananassa]